MMEWLEAVAEQDAIELHRAIENREECVAGVRLHR